MGMTVNRGAFPDAVRVKTVKDLKAIISNLPDNMIVEGFYDDAMGSGIVWVDAWWFDESDGPYLAIDVERERT